MNSDGSWEVGERFAELYEVVDVIRSGGMGLVYRVHHHGWELDLAVKAPRAHLVDTEQRVADFTGEAQAWVGLGMHPHTVDCLYVRTISGVPHVFAEWIDGGTLAQWVRTGRLYEGGQGVALARALDVAIQIAWGLDHAHRQGMVHQDVKPANVMMTSEGTAKVTDFGLARARARAGEAHTVDPGVSMLVGYGGMTPAYCSPEQAEAAAGGVARGLSRATDVWSWAITVLEMFMGGPPCQFGQAAAAVFEDYLRRGGPAGIPTMPTGLAEVLSVCFTTDPAQRRVPMAELAASLTELYRSVVGVDYPRENPTAARLLADGLSNKALSLHDLGQHEQAMGLWDEALALDPFLPQAVYNRGLLRWRAGHITDEELLAELDATRGGNHQEPWRIDYLVAQVHLERGDLPRARELLARANERSGDVEIRRALEQAHRPPHTGFPVQLSGHVGGVQAVAFSDDGARAATADRAGTIRVWDPVSGRCLDQLRREVAPAGLAHLEVSRDGRVVAWWDSFAAGLWVWRAGDRPVDLPIGGGTTVDSATLSPDGEVVAVATSDGTVALWDTVSTSRIWSAAASTRTDDGPGFVALSGSSRTRTRVMLDPARGEVIRYAWDSDLVEVWSMQGGTPVRTLECPNLHATSDDGLLLLLEVAGGRGAVWDRTTGATAAVDAPPIVDSVAATGVVALRFATEESGGSPRLWELAPRRCLRSFDREVVALSRDGRRVLTGDPGGEASIWPVSSPERPAVWSYVRPRGNRELSAADQGVRQARRRAEGLLAEGRTADAADELRRARAVVGYERHPELLRQWRTVNHHARRTRLVSAWQLSQIPTQVVAWADPEAGGVALTYDGRGDGPLRLVDLSSGRVRHELYRHSGLWSGAIRSDGAVGYSAEYRGRARVWDLRTGRPLHEVAIDEGGGWQLVSRHGLLVRYERLFVRPDRPQCRLTCFDVESGSTRWDQSFELELSRYDAQLAVDDSLLVVGTHAWEMDTGRLVASSTDGRLTVHGAEIRAVAYSRNKRGVRVSDPVRGGRGRELRCGWNPHGVGGAPGWFLAAGPTPGANLYLCGGGHNPEIQVWNLAANRRVRTLSGHTWAVHSLVVSADGRFAASAADDNTIRIWDVGAEKCLCVLQHPGVSELSASEDFHRLVAQGRTSGATRVWELDWEYDLTRETQIEAAP